MEIKKSLKTYDIRISKFASDLGISRPTLDNYIDLYEKGEKIPNEVYQQIFEYLFSTEFTSSIDFAQKYDYVMRNMLNKAASQAQQELNINRTNALENSLSSKITDGSVPKELLEFVNLLVDNSSNELVQAIYMYFNYSNGIEDMSKAEI